MLALLVSATSKHVMT